MLEYDFENSVGYWICTASHALRRALGQRLAEEGTLTLRQFEVLACLAVHGQLSQCELADQLGVEPPTMAGIVSRMERDGWLARVPCTQDRRRNTIHPTAEAERVWERMVTVCHDVRAQALTGINHDELMCFKEVCRKLLCNLGAGDGLPLLDPQPAAPQRAGVVKA